ncbi:MT-A70-domain-containing protein, partial [Suhomyces tanzawaensis NRRL Y-17324]
YKCDYATLNSILLAPTASTVLTKQKIRDRTPVKPFHPVCYNPEHSGTLSKICLGKRDLSYDKNDLPSTKQAHHLLRRNKHLISQQEYDCSQSKIHFLPVFNSHTEQSLGDCSYLDTCHKMKTCRYLHYFTLHPELGNSSRRNRNISEYTIDECFMEHEREVIPAQWIKCDIRYLPLLVLGKFAAIISDPAWDIHMSLPYGTCKDTELLSLNIGALQDEGILLLWVTGRSIEVGRKALKRWGYRNCDELIWVKLNQLKRTIVTGRTGHWLNHSKEHLLVGIKGNPIWLTRHIDTSVLISNTRETLRKPDEVYDYVERLVGIHTRKLEIFGRTHNTRPGWFTVGNQLNQSSIHEKEVILRYD